MTCICLTHCHTAIHYHRGKLQKYILLNLLIGIQYLTTCSGLQVLDGRIWVLQEFLNDTMMRPCDCTKYSLLCNFFIFFCEYCKIPYSYSLPQRQAAKRQTYPTQFTYLDMILHNMFKTSCARRKNLGTARVLKCHNHAVMRLHKIQPTSHKF